MEAFGEGKCRENVKKSIFEGFVLGYNLAFLITKNIY